MTASLPRAGAALRHARIAALLMLMAAAAALAWGASPGVADPAGSATAPQQAGLVDVAGQGTCMTLESGALRCWGGGSGGQNGTGSTTTIGDDELPTAVTPVDLGAGRVARAVSRDLTHACALLDDGSVRCWGSGLYGRLGYGNVANIGDNETPGSVGPVDLGAGRTAVAISAGTFHTCAILDTGAVRCWGRGALGALGIGNTQDVGDDETPGSVGPVDLGAGRTATAITAGRDFTCAILDTGDVRCWGYGFHGQLGTGTTADIGDDEAPGAVAPVDLGAGRTAVAIGAANYHVCAVLDTGGVRCWGFGSDGRLGLGNTNWIGDNETPGSVSQVNLGGATVTAIAVGDEHSCALTAAGSVHCWGLGSFGRLGYSATATIGDNEHPVSAGTVSLGGAPVVGLSAGGGSTCATRSDGTVTCWGVGSFGALGYGTTNHVGDDETPGSAGTASVGGVVLARVADLRVTVTPGAGSPHVGDEVVVSVAVTNDGPDDAIAPRLALVAAGSPDHVSHATAAGAYDQATGIWTPGTIANGATATLTLTLRATQVGPLSLTAAVATAPGRDPDSTPGNAIAEDDRAVGTVTVAAAPVVTPPAPPAPPADPAPGDPAVPDAPAVPTPTLPRPSGLSLELSRLPRRPTVRAYRVSGRLGLPASAGRAACRGIVTVTARIGRRTVTRRVAVGHAGSACWYATWFVLPPGERGAVRVRAVFGGNDLVGTIASRTVTAPGA